MKRIRFDIISVFPEIFRPYFDVSILRRAQERKQLVIATHNLRDFAEGKWRKVDDAPYGGGAGMVLMAPPILRAVRSVSGRRRGVKVLIMSAKGRPFTQRLACDFARRYGQIVIVTGRYEGIDERVRIALRAEEISLGPYVLTDGDIAAMAVVSAVARLVPGVIKSESLAEESHWNLLLKKEAAGRGRGLEYPHYTRPETFVWNEKRYRVPAVLRSGDHQKIDEWRTKRGGA